jgi:uncharacterized protein (DUF427 family)
MESVWDYPRPPRLERCTRRVRIDLGGLLIADSKQALRVLETSHPPVIYVPPGDIAAGTLRPSAQPRSFCEWKGIADYFDVVAGGSVARAAAWTYREPVPAFADLRDHVAFYPGRMDACRLDDELVRAQPGDFYGGWITDDIQGPFKGAAGTLRW